MADLLKLRMAGMANGGAALGRDHNERVVFVPQTIPGEEVTVELVEDKKRYARGRLVEVLTPAPERVPPRCPHFGPCGGCHFQHIDVMAQPRFKETILRDQLDRIGGLTDVVIRPLRRASELWAYADEVVFSPTPDGRLGFWSPPQNQVMAIETCHLLRPALLTLLEDIDLNLPGLRRLTLRRGDDDALMAILEVDGVEAPALEADFPISVALALPDGTAVTLVGDTALMQQISGRDFRVSAGSYFWANPTAAGALVDIVKDYVNLDGDQLVLELFSGVGLFTAFLAPAATEWVAVEQNPDAVADAAANLADLEAISLYEGDVVEVLPLLTLRPDVLLLNPPAAGLPPAVIDEIGRLAPERVVYVSADVATLARDGRRLTQAGYTLVEVQPIEMRPQTYWVDTVSLWQKTAVD